MKHTEKFIKLWQKICPQKETEEKDDALRALLIETQREIAASRQGLRFADSEALTDMYIYSIKASELRYSYLLRMAKAGSESA